MRGRIHGGWVIAYQDGEHRLLPDGEVLWTDDLITYVGPRSDEATDLSIELGPHSLVMPGLINTHVHSGTMAGQKLINDIGNPQFFQSGYLNVWAVARGKLGAGQIEDPVVGGRFTMLELLRGGTTTVIDLGASTLDAVQVIEDVGIRAYVGRMYGSARHVLTADGTAQLDPLPDHGRQALEAAAELASTIASRDHSRVRAMLYPSSPDTCYPELLTATGRVAAELGIGVQIHAAQNLPEFHEVYLRHGRTPIEYLDQVGLLTPHTILAHCLITTAHPFAHTTSGNDLHLIANSGASVSHNPLVFARRGAALHSFTSYLDAGITMSIGTDAYPRDMISEMRLASLLSKLSDETYLSGTARQVFDAATVGAADALERQDLGRLMAGAQADIVSVDLASLRIGPYRDPLQALVTSAVADDVRTVIVAGDVLLQDGQFLKQDAAAILEMARQFAHQAWDDLPEWHRGMTVDEYAPQALRPYA